MPTCTCMCTEVQGLIEQTMPADEHCHVDEYLNDDPPVCLETDIDSWKFDFLQQAIQSLDEFSGFWKAMKKKPKICSAVTIIKLSNGQLYTTSLPAFLSCCKVAVYNHSTVIL